MSEMLNISRGLLGDYERQAALKERERIIALLEQYKPHDWREDKTRLYILQMIRELA